MKNTNKWCSSLWFLAALGVSPIVAADSHIQMECTAAEPCVKILHAEIGTSDANMVYGDKITLTYDGSVMTMEEEVTAWDSVDNPERTVKYIPGPNVFERNFIPGWSFEVEIGGETHPDILIYRDPDVEGGWIVDWPEDDTVHGGTAHMR